MQLRPQKKGGVVEVEVLAIRTVGKGLRIAHVKAGKLYGDVPALDDVTEGCKGFLRSSLGIREGRLQCFLRVEKFTDQKA
jgi:hypothetical protein